MQFDLRARMLDWWCGLRGVVCTDAIRFLHLRPRPVVFVRMCLDAVKKSTCVHMCAQVVLVVFVVGGMLFSPSLAGVVVASLPPPSSLSAAVAFRFALQPLLYAALRAISRCVRRAIAFCAACLRRRAAPAVALLPSSSVGFSCFV